MSVKIPFHNSVAGMLRRILLYTFRCSNKTICVLLRPKKSWKRICGRVCGIFVHHVVLFHLPSKIRVIIIENDVFFLMCRISSSHITLSFILFSMCGIRTKKNLFKSNIGLSKDTYRSIVIIKVCLIKVNLCTSSSTYVKKGAFHTRKWLIIILNEDAKLSQING